MSSSLVYVQQIMSQDILVIVLALGIIGNILLILVFSQRYQRISSCSYYILTAAILSIVGSTWAVIPLICAAYSSDPLAKSIYLCRIRGYIIHICAMSFRTLIVLAAVDRYAISSDRASIKAFFSSKIARRACVCVPLFWPIVSVHRLIWVSIENNRCFVYGLYGFIYSIYQLICFGLLPLILMAFFGILTLKNISSARRRIRSLGPNETNLPENILRKRDRDMALLVYIEVIISFICTFPYSINSIYTTLTSSIPNKSSERLLIESFSIFITMSFLLYLKYSTTFYVYVITSPSFRRSLKKVLLKYYRKFKRLLYEE